MQIGSEMATLQEKNPKMDPKKRFFSQKSPIFELLKPVPESPHQTNFFGRDIIAQCDQVACALFDDRS